MFGPCIDVADVFGKESSISQDDFNKVLSTLKASIGEISLSFDVNSHLLPVTFSRTINNDLRYFEVDWGTIEDSKQVVRKVLVSLRDVTEIKKLRDESRVKATELLLIDELLNMEEKRFNAFTKRSLQYIEEVRALIRNTPDNVEEIEKLVLLNLHTIKGLARTFSLSHVAEQVHIVEENIDPKDNENIQKALKKVEAAFEIYSAIALHRLGWDAREEYLRFPKNVVLDGLQSLAVNRKTGRLKQFEDVKNALHVLESQMERFSGATFEGQIVELAQGLDSIARSLGKEPPQLRLSGRQVVFTEAGIELLQGTFAHLLRNSIDHGLEKPEQRRELGKSSAGSINIHVEIQDELVLTYWDDGVGLDPKLIREKIQSQGLELQGDSSHIDLINYIFKSGFSTREEITELSGRSGNVSCASLS